MAVLYPGASYRPLGSQTQPRMSRYDIFCYHTMVGYLTSTDNMFHQNGYGGTESHFGIGGKWGGDVAKGYDGTVFQWQDLAYTADANFQGNPRILSVETADNAPQSASNLAPWTSRQLDSLVTLTVWICRKYSIPPILVQDSRPGRRGLAYHRQGVEHSDGIGSHPGYLVSGGERWSTSVGKQCPGQARINQISAIIIPRVQDILNGDTETDMAINDDDIDRIWNKANDITDQAPAGSLHEIDLRTEEGNLQLQVDKGISKALANPNHALTKNLKEIKDAIAALTTAQAKLK